MTKNFEQIVYKKQKLQIFKFELHNIKDLTIKLLLDLLEINAFSLRFELSEKDFLNHLINIGFEKSKNNLFDFEFKKENYFIKLCYSIFSGDQNYIFFRKIIIPDKTFLFDPYGNLKHIQYNKKIEKKLIEKSVSISYDVYTIDSKKVEFISSISYFYDDKRKNDLKDFILHFIIEYPIEIDNFNISVFDPIYYNNINKKTLKTSQLVLNFNDKDLILFNTSSSHRHNLIDFKQIFSKEEIELLNIIVF